MSIRARIIAAVLAVIAVVNVASVVYYVDRERAVAVSRLENTIAKDDRLLQIVTAGPLYDGNIAQLNAILDSIFANPDVVEVSLRETRGDIRLKRARSDAAEEKGKRIAREIPVLRGRDELGRVYVTYTTVNIDRRLSQSRDAVILFSVALMAVVSAVIYLIADGLTRPIERLTRAAREIAEGDLGRDIDTRGAQELSILAQSFVRMRDSVREKIADLADKNRLLRGEFEERVRTEEALRRSEQRFRALVELSSDWYWETDANHRFTFRDGDILRRLGIPPEHDYGKTRWELDFPNMTEADWSLHRATLERHEEFRDLLVERRLPGGDTHWAAISGRPLFDEEGRFIGYHGTGKDVTPQVAAERALRESEAKISDAYAILNDAIESAPAAVAIYDAGDRLIACNSRFRAFFAFDPDFVRPGVEFGTLIRRFTESGQIAQPQRAGEAWLEERHRVHRDPKGMLEMALVDGRWLQVTETRTQSGGTVTVYTDITALKGREAELQRLNEELERKVGERTSELAAINRELEAFAYSVSHDLRAPLRAVDGFSRILFEDFGANLNADARGYLERVRSAVQRMDRLIDDMLQLSRVTRAEMHPVAVDLSRLARQIAAQLKSAAPERSVELRIEPRLDARGDARLLEIALTNLLENAWKYTGKTEQARIELSAEVRNGETVFCVRDNGVGFDMQFAGKLFGAFQRLHSERDFPGTGIGLATVARIVHRHGGRVWAQSEPGKGASFFFTLSGGASRGA